MGVLVQKRFDEVTGGSNAVLRLDAAAKFRGAPDIACGSPGARVPGERRARRYRADRARMARPGSGGRNGALERLCRLRLVHNRSFCIPPTEPWRALG